MLKIDNENNITITKGDTLTLTLNLKKDGDDYVPVEGDSIRFAVSKGYVGETAYQLEHSPRRYRHETITAVRRIAFLLIEI